MAETETQMREEIERVLGEPVSEDELPAALPVSQEPIDAETEEISSVQVPYNPLLDDLLLGGMSEEDEQASPPTPLSVRRRVDYRAVLLLMLIFLSPIVATAAYWHAHQTAHITLSMKIHPLNFHGQATVAITALSPFTLFEKVTLQSSGRIQRQAQAAHGAITFYNALPQAQLIAAGTLLIASDGVQVVTDSDALVPGSSMPTEGSVTVGAHALVPGVAGNIVAGDINGPCCRAYILAKNGVAFRGGQDAADYATPTADDIASAKMRVAALIRTDMKNTLPTLATGPQQLFQPVPCATHISASAAPGAPAASVTVSEQEQCAPFSYSGDALSNQQSQAIAAAIASHFGAQFFALPNPSIVIGAVTVVKTSATIAYNYSGQVVYRFSQAALQQLKSKLAGKSSEQADVLLFGNSEVEQVRIAGPLWSATLPSDPGAFSFDFTYSM